MAASAISTVRARLDRARTPRHRAAGMGLRGAAVGRWGLAGDRRFMIVDDNDVMLTQRECQTLVKVKPAWDGSRLTLRAAGVDDHVVTPGEPGTDLVDTAVFSTP